MALNLRGQHLSEIGDEQLDILLIVIVGALLDAAFDPRLANTTRGATGRAGWLLPLAGNSLQPNAGHPAFFTPLHWGFFTSQGNAMTPHFKLSEFIRSDTAARLRISNIPSPAHVANLERLALSLEEVRALLGHPLLITSGYRSSELNRAIDGSATSSHSHGLAADFHCPGFGSDVKVCQAIADSSIQFGQLIFERARSTWIHFGIGDKMQREVLSWRSRAGYRNGIIKI
jgi:hypothetical protein